MVRMGRVRTFVNINSWRMKCETLPWLLMGDLNESLPSKKNQGGANDGKYLRTFLQNSEGCDLSLAGSILTWSNR